MIVAQIYIDTIRMRFPSLQSFPASFLIPTFNFHYTKAHRALADGLEACMRRTELHKVVQRSNSRFVPFQMFLKDYFLNLTFFEDSCVLSNVPYVNLYSSY